MNYYLELRIELHHAIGVDTSDLAVKKDFIALKSEIDINRNTQTRH